MAVLPDARVCARQRGGELDEEARQALSLFVCLFDSRQRIYGELYQKYVLDSVAAPRLNEWD